MFSLANAVWVLVILVCLAGLGLHRFIMRLREALEEKYADLEKLVRERENTAQLEAAVTAYNEALVPYNENLARQPMKFFAYLMGLSQEESVDIHHLNI